jgi:hypothetical protein
MTFGRPLERLITDWARHHDLATMQCRIKCGQLLRESQLGLSNRLTRTFESWADTSTGCPTLKRADRTTAAGIRTATLFPHYCTVNVALFAMIALQCINKSIRWSPIVNSLAKGAFHADI